MYVPYYDAILHAIGTSREELKGANEIRIPLSLFKFLLRSAVAHSEVNLTGYLNANRDIREAAKAGRVPDPKQHYVDFGFFEGRRGATPAVDETWYRRTYSDISSAIRTGAISSGTEHFDAIGAQEFRSPSAAYSSDTDEWRQACGKL
jgi:hypothetical protein